MHYVYVLRSTSDDGFYIGYSANLRRRFTQHAEGGAFATSYRRPWKLIYYEAYTEQADALGRERYLKSGGGRRFLELQLAHYLKKDPIRRKPRERSRVLDRGFAFYADDLYACAEQTGDWCEKSLGLRCSCGIGGHPPSLCYGATGRPPLQASVCDCRSCFAE